MREHTHTHTHTHSFRPRLPRQVNFKGVEQLRLWLGRQKLGGETRGGEWTMSMPNGPPPSRDFHFWAPGCPGPRAPRQGARRHRRGGRRPWAPKRWAPPTRSPGATEAPPAAPSDCELETETQREGTQRMKQGIHIAGAIVINLSLSRLHMSPTVDRHRWTFVDILYSEVRGMQQSKQLAVSRQKGGVKRCT